MMWSVSSRTVAARFGPRSVSTARLNERCWLLSPCVLNFVLICVALSLLYVPTTSPSCGSIVLKTLRARWLQQFEFSIVHRAGRDHGNADCMSRVPTSPCGQCARVDCPPVDTAIEVVDQPFDPESVGDSEDADLIPLQSGEDWVAQLDDDLSRPASQSGDNFRITALQPQDSTCMTLLTWIRSDVFPPWSEVKCLCPELRLLWHHRNNLSVDANGVIWRKKSSPGSELQLLVPKPVREQLFLAYHASLFGGHLGRNWTLARLSHRFYWSGMSDDVKHWLGQCTVCMKRMSLTGRHHPLGNIPTGHRWDRIAMDILDVCDPTPDSYRYILVIADYFSKWTEAFPIKNKCADKVTDVLVDKIILRFGMHLVIHSDQEREFENGLMKSLCILLGCVKTRTAPYHPESDGMVDRFNCTCLMMLSMFVNDRLDHWSELLPFVMHAYRTSVHESPGHRSYSGHPEGTGRPDYLHSCGRFKAMSGPPRCCLDPRTVDS